MLFRLIYTSKLQPSVDLEALLSDARRKNEAAGITGGLAVLDGVCLQYLEGDREGVEALFDRIACDIRHAGVKVLERRKITRRMFTGWQMAMLTWAEETKMIFYSFSPGSDLDLYETHSDTAAPLFRAWAATSNWERDAQSSRLNANWINRAEHP